MAAGGGSTGPPTAIAPEAYHHTQVHLPVLPPRERVSAEYRASGGGGQGADGRKEGRRTTDRETRKFLEVDEDVFQNRDQQQESSSMKLRNIREECHRKHSVPSEIFVVTFQG